MTLLQQAELSLNNLKVSKLRTLIGNGSDDIISSEESLAMHANNGITNNYSTIRLLGYNGTAGDDLYLYGINTTTFSNPPIDIDGVGEASVTIAEGWGAANEAKRFFFGWGDKTILPQPDIATWVNKHVGFFGRATTYTGDYSLYASTANGTSQDIELIDDNFDINSFKNLRVRINSSTDIKFYIEGELVHTKTSGTYFPTDDQNLLPFLGIFGDSGVPQYPTLSIQRNGYFINTIL